MKPFLSFAFLFCCIVVIISVTTSGCANIIPPGGGAKDTIPPKLLTAIPKDSSLNFNSNKIVLTFDEYVEVKEVSKNLVVSPLPKNTPIVDYKLKTVTIKLKDSLEPNTTYSLDFGNGIVDVNENNPAKNFMYVFSTGNEIDNNTFSGKIILAETGTIDSSLIAVLYNNINDTAVLHEKPRYIAKLKGDGSFTFHHLPEGTFALYAMPNDYSKKYDDSTKLFAFADSVIYIKEKTNPITLYAYQEAKREEKTATSSSPSGKSKKENEQPKYIKYTTSLEAGKQDILSNQLIIKFVTPLNSFDSTRILLTDTNYQYFNNYTIEKDTSNTQITITTTWKENTPYNLLLYKNAFKDSLGNALEKNDTLHFWTKKTTDYGSVKIRFNNLDTSKYPVLLIYKQTELVEAIKITQKELSRKLFKPGEYVLKILFDKNNNGVWDAGNYNKKLQPEIVYILDKKLSVRANWDNETDITLQ
ncbi:MAG: Ig-like domain-containing protein [Chitinophagaceae bacterium]|nr:Ig-like domain-containing protein [Chitinophagaceae bacterium]MCW5904180.1 Ig-like domain-containing protein [Chitinophagaceae bacterium]